MIGGKRKGEVEEDAESAVGTILLMEGRAQSLPCSLLLSGVLVSVGLLFLSSQREDASSEKYIRVRLYVG